jgi:hypothetical protein
VDIEGAEEGGPIDFGGTKIRGVGVGAGVPMLLSVVNIFGDAEEGASTGIGASVNSNVGSELSTKSACELASPSFPPLSPTANPTTMTRSTATAATRRR